MKGAVSVFLIFIVNAIVMDYVDAGLMGFKYAIILAVIDMLALCVYLMCERKKSATCAKRNGQAHKEHNKYNQHKYTPCNSNLSSYKGIAKERGKFVGADYAFGYALDSVLNNEEDQKEFVEWFYSGNWIEVEDKTKMD